MTESALSDDADSLYRPLGGIGPWADAAAGLDEAAGVGAADPAWAGLVGRGMLLAAAHQSAALDGMHHGDRAQAMALLRGVTSVADLGEDARAHVQANYDALRLGEAANDDVLASERWIRTVHEVACRPQLTHPVRGEDGVHDHVLATGDFKHHPNHERARSGRWIAHAPVSLLRAEMGRLLAALQSDGFTRLPPVVRAAYAHHGLSHVAPFADGNGRVARVLASAHLLRATSVPLLVFADEASAYEDALAGDAEGSVAYVADRTRATAELLRDMRAAGPASPEERAALARWRQRADAGTVLRAHLPAAVEGALDRHRGRADLGWLSPLTEVVLDPSLLVLRDPSTGVAETIEVHAHPLVDEGVVMLRAPEAGLRLDAAPADVAGVGEPPSGALAARLDEWLDRVVSTLALRVAAACE